MSYTRQEVETLLPAVWDKQIAYGLQNPYAPAPDMPKAASNKAAANTLYAMLADIRLAWAKTPLTHKQRQAVYLRYALGMTEVEAGVALGIRKQSTQERIDLGVGRLTAWLNGDEYVDGYESDDEEEERAS